MSIDAANGADNAYHSFSFECIGRSCTEKSKCKTKLRWPSKS